jgi:diaminopimelate decarboxylase
MDHVTGLVKKFFGLSAGELQIDGVPVSAIASEYGTPIFIYASSVLDRKLAVLRSTLPPRFMISYSVKANPNTAILKHFVSAGCGLEIASGGELHLGLRAGCPTEKIVFAGPGKSEQELEFALTRNVGEIHAESLLEIARINSISRRIGVTARVAVRVNPGGEAQGGAMRMGGRPAPFGVDEEKLDGVLDRILGESSIEFQGIHLFTGTQILDHSILTRQYRTALEIAKRTACRIKLPLRTVDFGGGFGIPYFSNEQELDMEKLRRDLKLLMEEIKDDPCFEATQFMVEPGRYLVGEAGVYVTRVNDIKVSRGKKFLIVDGGMNHHLAASGNLGQTIKRNFPVALLNRLEDEPKETVDVVGPLCTPLDVLAREANLPPGDVGDLIGVFQSGAYARTASPLGFLSHPSPPEVLVYNGRCRLIRYRGTYGHVSDRLSSEI